MNKDRYAAKLLFEFDKKLNGMSIQKKRVCEYRIFVLHAESDESAYSAFLTLGKKSELSYYHRDYEIFYNFIGIVELISLSYLDDNEVWYYFQEKLSPHKRASRLIPPKNQLALFKEISGRNNKIKL